MDGVFNYGSILRKCVKKFTNHFNHYVSLSVYEFLGIVPKGLRLGKAACIGGVDADFFISMDECIVGN